MSRIRTTLLGGVLGGTILSASSLAGAQLPENQTIPAPAARPSPGQGQRPAAPPPSTGGQRGGSSGARSVGHGSQSWQVSASVGLGSVASKFYFGGSVALHYVMDLDPVVLRVGPETGIYLGPTSPFTFGIPILGAATVELRVATDVVRPYFGLAMGLGIWGVSSSSRYVDPKTGKTYESSSSATDAYFMFVARPGARFGASKRWFAELPLGTVANAFLVLPSVGVTF